LLLIIAVVFCKKSFDPKNFLQSIALPFEKITSQILWSSKKLLFETQSRETLINLCRELANENISLKMQLQQNFDLKNRLEALENLTQIGQQLAHKKIFARVIRRDVTAWFESITLNKGKLEGVRENAIVVANGDIVGKITAVAENSSTATLSSSPKFRLAVCLENFASPMIFMGNGHAYGRNQSGKCELKTRGILKNIPTHAAVFLTKGTRIICSALAAHTPGGLTVGYVENIHPSIDSMFLSADVALPNTLSDFCETLILIPDDL
jgi:rod shape-determining protein MreC